MSFRYIYVFVLSHLCTTTLISPYSVKLYGPGQQDKIFAVSYLFLNLDAIVRGFYNILL